MKRFKTILKWTGITLLILVISVFSFGYWFMSLIPKGDSRQSIKQSTRADLPYLSENLISERGKVLIVVTSVDEMGSSGKKTGYELTELSRAYYVFEANGFEVDIASPKGGEPPVVIDDEDMGAYDFAFQKDAVAQYKSTHTIPIASIVPSDYEAIYFVGGKGAMYDFPNNTSIQNIVKDFYQSGKVVGAVCHGPAALVNVTLDNGTPLLQNKSVSSFTNSEELLLISEAKEIFPFLLQDKLSEQGATFNEGHMYLKNVSLDDNLVTGQNPWSTWGVAESMVKQMGYVPKRRNITAEENTIEVLVTYESDGYKAARTKITEMINGNPASFDRMLLAKHSIIAGMQGRPGKLINLVRLVSHAKGMQES